MNSHDDCSLFKSFTLSTTNLFANVSALRYDRVALKKDIAGTISSVKKDLERIALEFDAVKNDKSMVKSMNEMKAEIAKIEKTLTVVFNALEERISFLEEILQDEMFKDYSTDEDDPLFDDDIEDMDVKPKRKR